MHVSERRACTALGSTARRSARYRGAVKRKRLTADIIALARKYGRYGYRKIAGLLKQAGWIMTNGSSDLATRGAEGPP